MERIAGHPAFLLGLRLGEALPLLRLSQQHLQMARLFARKRKRQGDKLSGFEGKSGLRYHTQLFRKFREDALGEWKGKDRWDVIQLIRDKL